MMHPIVGCLLIINFTWIYFGFVMRMQVLRDTGKLKFSTHPFRYVLAYANLPLGYILDASTNVISSIIFLELPQWFSGEFLFTNRLCRLYTPVDNNWRSKLAFWIGEEFLNDIDPSGKHVT